MAEKTPVAPDATDDGETVRSYFLAKVALLGTAVNVSATSAVTVSNAARR